MSFQIRIIKTLDPSFVSQITISNHYRTLEDCVNGGRKANGTEPNSAAGTVL